MTNSLFKDSHITHQLCYSQKPYSGSCIGKRASQNERKEYSSATVRNNIGISVNKPADKVSFRGLSDIKLATEPDFKLLITNARISLGNTSNKKILKTLINDAVEFVTGIKKEVAENVKSFSEENKPTIQTVIDKSKELLVKENEKKPLTSNALSKAIKKTIGSAVNVFHTIEKPGFMYTNRYIKNLFKNSGIYQVFYGAGFALLLTGLLRPATIMALPGQKKNKDDKKYAAAQSISSGLIGFVLAFIVSTPISKALENFVDGINGKKLKDKDDREKIKKANVYLDKNKENYKFFFKDEEILKKEMEKNGKTQKEIDTILQIFQNRGAAAKTYLNQAVDILMAAPKAMITIALLPIILKYIFGLEKRKDTKTDTKTQPIQDYSSMNFKSSNIQNKKVFKDFNNGGVK